MTCHTGTINIAYMNDLVFPDVDYQCNVSVDRHGDLVIEEMQVSLWRVSMGCFDWVNPNTQLANLVIADVERDYHAGRLDLDDNESNPAKLYKEDVV